VELALTRLNAESGVAMPGLTITAYRDQVTITAKAAAWSGVAPSALGQQFACNGCAESLFAALFLRVGPDWFVESRFPQLQVGRATVFHELFHNAQGFGIGKTNADRAFQTPPDQVRVYGPAWLAEGSAQWWGYQLAAEEFGVAWESVLGVVRQSAVSDPTPLQSMEPPLGFRAAPRPYDVGLFATDLLMRGVQPSALARYYSLIGAGEGWESAFQVAFGRSATEFYAEFEAHRASLR